MKVSQLIEEIESNPQLASLNVSFRGKKHQIYPWLKGRYFHKFVVGEESLAEKNTSLLFRQITSFFYGFFHLFKRYDAWGFSNVQERVLVDGKYFDKLYDGFNELKDYRILLIELQLFKQYPRRKIYSKHIVSKAFFMLQEEVYQRLFLRKIHLENETILSEIEQKTGVTIDAKNAVRKYLAQYAVMRFWLRILKNPKLVFTTVSYSNFGYILAFHERGIKVVELQHGVISEGHQAYNYKQTFEANAFPDALAVWSKKEYSFLHEKTHFPTKTIFPIGRPILEKYASLAIESTTLKTICVSLQDGPIGDRLINELLSFNERFPSQLQFQLQCRRTTEATYRERFDFPSNFDFFTGTIYENIAQSDLHITAFSTSAIESLVIGKAVIFLDESGKAKEVFGDLIASNPYCSLVHNAEELKAFLSELTIPAKADVQSASEDLNTPNYTLQLKKLIANLTA